MFKYLQENSSGGQSVINSGMASAAGPVADVTNGLQEEFTESTNSVASQISNPADSSNTVLNGISTSSQNNTTSKDGVAANQDGGSTSQERTSASGDSSESQEDRNQNEQSIQIRLKFLDENEKIVTARQSEKIADFKQYVCSIY